MAPIDPPGRLLGRTARFATVGASNTIVGLAVIWAAWRGWGWSDVAANVCGYAAGFAWSFVLNRSWTFAHEGPAGRSFARFTLVCALAYGLNLAVLAVSRSAMGPESFWPHVLGMGVYSVAAFLGSEFYAFRLHRPAEPQP